MKGFISVEIPTKPYIKAYITHKLGPEPILNKDTLLGHKLYDLLEHSLNNFGSIPLSSMYITNIKVYIPLATFKNRGSNLNVDNVRNFNTFVEKMIKHRFYEIMDNCMIILPNFNTNLAEVRRELGIDIEAWSDDSMKKDYYRYRLKVGSKIKHKKTFP